MSAPGHRQHSGIAPGVRVEAHGRPTDRQGHLGSLGYRSPRPVAPRAAPLGHRSWQGAGVRSSVTDNTVIEKRLAWELYSNCERAPLGWEEKL